jgi:exodeoxyribonuclease VII large subunit
LKNSIAQLNPHNVLARGYAIVQNENGLPLVNGAQLQLKETVKITLSQGSAKANIVEIGEDV